MRTFFLGLGSGRCGTTTLAHVLSAAGGGVTHELGGKNYVAWDGEQERALKSVHAMLETRSQEVVGDCAFYWLNYYRAIKELCAELNVKFVCLALERNQQDCIQSWLNKTGYTNARQAHWSDDPPVPDPWDKCFPSLGKAADDKRDHVQQYLEYYYSICAVKGISIWDMHKTFNTTEGIADLLESVGLTADPLKLVNSVRNAG